MSRLAAPKTEFHTLYLRSRILGEIIKELKLDELRVTKMIISADKTIEHTAEKHPIPELEQYTNNTSYLKRKTTRKEIMQLPLRIRTMTQDQFSEKSLTSTEGIDLAYVNKVLTEPPYDFPYVRVEEFEATILKAEEPEKPTIEEKSATKTKKEKKVAPTKPTPIPKTIKFKRTAVKQASIVSTLTPSPSPGRKYTLQLETTTRKEAVERIRDIIAEHNPIKFCELVMKSDVITVCKEILGKED
jgi:hypothetical protein